MLRLLSPDKRFVANIFLRAFADAPQAARSFVYLSENNVIWHREFLFGAPRSVNHEARPNRQCRPRSLLVVVVPMRLYRFIKSNPDSHNHVCRIADEPCIDVVVRRASLAC